MSWYIDKTIIYMEQTKPVGINVAVDKKVSVDSNHEHLVVTGHEKNPTVTNFEDMHVSFVFRRVKSKSRANDGNPLIYALKNLQGYTITSKEISNLVRNFRIVLRKILSGIHYDIIVPMPSRHGISLILAKRVVRHQKGGMVVTNFLRKKTNGEVLADLTRIHSTKHHRDLVALRKKLEKDVAKHPFSMKDVTTQLRPMIHPLTINRVATSRINKVLLVDDLMSSGATLKSAYDVVKTVYPDAEIDALCLLSPVR